MSVKEAIKRIEKQDLIAKTQKEQLQEAAAKAYDGVEAARKEKYQAGYEKARRTQMALLEELRDTGVVALIEEMTGPIKPIEYIGEDDGSNEYRKKLQNMLIESFHDVERHFKGNWTANEEGPKKQLDGSPTDTLVLEISRVWSEHLVPNMSPNFVKPTLTVMVEYGTDKHLKISGEKTTFIGRVYPENLPQYEQSLAAAFHKPKISR